MCDLFTVFEGQKTDCALGVLSKLTSEHLHHGGAKTFFNSFVHGFFQVQIIATSLRSHLRSHFSQCPIAVELSSTSCEVVEVVEFTKLMRDILKAEDMLCIVVFTLVFNTLVTAACKDRVEDEDWDPGNNENWMLEGIDNQ